MTSVTGRRILVVGLGASGFSAARTLAGLGAQVMVTESAATGPIRERAARLQRLGVRVEVGGHDLDALSSHEIAVVSPGIPPRAPVIEHLAGAGVEIIGEVEMAYRLAKCNFLAVTGTNGKTTTTALLAAILAQAGVPSVAAGNIGLPLIDAIFMVPEDGAVALEVSSFQLATLKDFAPSVAVLLNVAEDHTDWHGSIEGYAAAKARITLNQKPDDPFLVNADDPRVMGIARDARSRVIPFSATSHLSEGLWIDDGWVMWNGARIVRTECIGLPGVSGTEDALGAIGAALEYGVDPAAVEPATSAFRPLDHRMDVVATWEGVTYIDDSKATNPHATLAAVRGLKDVVLIAGGRSKGIDLSSLAETVPPVRTVVALGEAAAQIENVFDSLVPVRRAESMAAAVSAAHDSAVAGGSVLLSPACASLDMYGDYAERGDDFAAEVRALVSRA